MIKLFNSKILKEKRKALRNNMTQPEQILWYHLRRSQFMGVKFRRQESVGRYILDFYAPSIKYCIEIDGESHGNSLEYDRERSLFLNSLGIKVARFWNADVIKNTEGVLSILEQEISPFLTSPQKGEEKIIDALSHN